MKIVKKEADIKPLIITIGELKTLFFKQKKIMPCRFNEITRVLMNQETKSELDLSLGIVGETTRGIKILIDNDIPDGECEIFVNALYVI